MSCSKLPSNSQKLMLVDKVDIVTAAIGHVLATEGGFCTGSAGVIVHQRLSSSGYVFFASLPPYLASAVITAINVLEENPHLITELKKNIATLRKGLSDVQGLEIVSDPKSPIVFLKLKNSTGSLKGDLQVLDDIAERVLAGVEEVSFSLKVMVNKQRTKLICPFLDRECQDDSLLQNVVAILPFHNATVGERARWRFCIEIRATTKEANCTRHSSMINTT